MEDRRVLLTPRATLCFGSLGFVYTGPVETVVGRTFARPPRPNVLTGAVGRATFVRGFSDETIIGMLGPNPTYERLRLVAFYLTDLAFQASGAEPLSWGEFLERYTTMYPPWTARPLGRPGGGLRQQLAHDRRHLQLCDNPEDTDHAACDPTRECNVCVASTLSSSDPEPAPCHRATDAQ
jgi:hypothetical protein